MSKTIEKDTLAGEKYDEVHEIQGCLVLLTPGGHEIFRYVIIGILNKQIAYELAFSEKTVKVHPGLIMEKLLVDSVAELIRLEVAFSSTC